MPIIRAMVSRIAISNFFIFFSFQAIKETRKRFKILKIWVCLKMGSVPHYSNFIVSHPRYLSIPQVSQFLPRFFVYLQQREKKRTSKYFEGIKFPKKMPIQKCIIYSLFTNFRTKNEQATTFCGRLP